MLQYSAGRPMPDARSRPGLDVAMTDTWCRCLTHTQATLPSIYLLLVRSWFYCWMMLVSAVWVSIVSGPSTGKTIYCFVSLWSEQWQGMTIDGSDRPVARSRRNCHQNTRIMVRGIRVCLQALDCCFVFIRSKIFINNIQSVVSNHQSFASIYISRKMSSYI